MSKSTPHLNPRVSAPSPLWRLLAACCLISTVLAGPLVQSAPADGDPASDVLATQTLFLPQDARLSAGTQAQLVSLLSAAQRSRYRIRVAMIASPSDLGSITELWQQPANYARFLGQELSLVYRGELLVVMPGGFGLYRDAGVASSAEPTPGGWSAPGHAPGPATLVAIQRLAAASGHPLALSAPRVTSTDVSSGDTVPWLVFTGGVVLVIAAWAASIRARPLGLAARRSTTT